MNSIENEKDLHINRKCMICDKDYKGNYHHQFTNNIENYCKYLGCCSEVCYMKLDEDLKNDLFIKGFFNALSK